MSPPALAHLSVGELTGLAGVDPWELQDQLLSGRPDQIDDLAGEFHRVAGHVAEGDSVFAQAREHFSLAYQVTDGVDTINESREVQTAKSDFPLSQQKLAAIARDLEEIAAGLADAQNTSRLPIDGLDSVLHVFDAEAGAPDLTPAQYQALVADAAAAVRSAGGQIRNCVDAYEIVLDARIADIEANGWTAAVDLDDGARSSPIPPPTSDPRDVNRWWKGLSASERQRMVSEHAAQIGDLNGVPTDDRSAANLRLMHRDLDTVTDAAAKHHMKTEEVVAHPDRYGITDRQRLRYTNAVKAGDGLARQGGATGQQVYLLAYRPEALDGRGAGAVAIGNPDTADNTTVLVPGTGNSMAGGWLSSRDPLNVYEQAKQADPSHTTSVVAWMGYQTPDSPRDLHITSPNLAREGSVTLARDVNGLWASHDGGAPSHVTVSGHSYGSTTVADAAARGMHANDVVLVGCPGTDMARSASDFHLDGGHVYVGDASADPVGQAGEYHYLSTGAGRVLMHGHPFGLGADPASAGFGSTRFDAQVPGHTGSFDFGAHTRYYEVGNESLHNIVTIATGHGDHLESQGMAAPLRQGAGWNIGHHHFPIPGAPHNYDTEVDRPARTGLEFDASRSDRHY